MTSDDDLNCEEMKSDEWLVGEEVTSDDVEEEQRE